MTMEKHKELLDSIVEKATLNGIAIGYKATMQVMQEKYGIEPEQEETVE